MKTSVSIGRSFVLTVALVGLGALSVHAQTVAAAAPAIGPAKGIGPAAANSKQNKILSTALSPETKQTLQEAMDSFPEPAAAHGK